MRRALLVAVATAAVVALCSGGAVPAAAPGAAPAAAPAARGSYTVPGLGARKQAVLAVGGTTLDLAVAMLETDGMTADYPYGDGKTGDAANFGIFKQNWHMLRQAVPWFGWLGPADSDYGAALNGDLYYDVWALHAAQERWGQDLWFAGHRNGETGLARPGTADIAAYREAVLWIRAQLDADPRRLSDDTRFWVAVPAI